MSLSDKIHLGDYCDAPTYAPNDCTIIGIFEEKDMAWLLLPKGGTTVVPIGAIVLHRDKSKKVDDETIKALSGLPSEEMREHLEMYHPLSKQRMYDWIDDGLVDFGQTIDSMRKEIKRILEK